MIEIVKKMDEVKANIRIVANLDIITDMFLRMPYDYMDEDDAKRLRAIFVELKDTYLKYNNRYNQNIDTISEWMEMSGGREE